MRRWRMAGLLIGFLLIGILCVGAFFILLKNHASQKSAEDAVETIFQNSKVASETTEDADGNTGGNESVISGWTAGGTANGTTGETITGNTGTSSASSTGTAAPSADYILPDSSSRYLTEQDITGLSASQLRLARNEIFARHGRIFASDDLKTYFESKSWYQGTVQSEVFDADLDSRINDFERANIELIKTAEAAAGQ